MALVEETLFGTQDKVQIAIERLRAFEPSEGYYVAFSGGKYSQVVYHLCKEASVKFDAHYNHTTVDPPEVIYFRRKYYPDVIVDYHGTTMWKLIVRKGMPPTRVVRYCCDELKEGGGKGRIVVTGVRWEESSRRKHSRGLLELNNDTKAMVRLMNDNDDARRLFETCTIKSRHTLNPIIDWTAAEVWEYLNSRNIPHCCLYDEGYSRIGCIGCPLAGPAQMKAEFARYPKYRDAYIRAFEKMIVKRRDSGKPYTQWKTGEEVMQWWLWEGTRSKVDKDQMSLWGNEEGVVYRE